jgi:hypothetical protein
MHEMRDRDAPATPRAPARGRAPEPTPRVAGALALQRAVGNRAATRVLSRWAAHPDKDKKGVLVPDVVAEGYIHFNPPKNT